METFLEIANDLYERASNRTGCFYKYLFFKSPVFLGSLFIWLFDFKDPRVAGYPLVTNDPRPVLAIIGAYLFFVIYGQKYMQNRPAFNVPVWVLFSYNFSLVILSIYIVQQVLTI